jgi:hypothetical protein
MNKSKFSWKAEYINGDILSEAKDIGYHHIDRSKLCFFSLEDRETKETKLKIEILPDQNLIWRRRYAVHSNGKQEIAHLVGKQINKDGKNYQWLALLFESDGRVEFFDKFNANNIFLNEVVLLDFEK